MSSSVDNSTTRRRPHDAEASRTALLRAAREVFDERGYDRATTREIGERAGVDPALIARYFDCKEGLFLAALAAAGAGEELDFPPEEIVGFLLESWEERGHGPISRALASPAVSAEVRGTVHSVLRERLLRRQAETLRERGVQDPELRVELLIALALGAAITRANGTLGSLATGSRERVLATLRPAIAALCSPR